MARPRSFDHDAVVEAAMCVFWKQGYASTSMSDIYAATGLKPGNLYATFKDKESLFQTAFLAYAERFRATMPTSLSGLAAVKAWIDTQVALAGEDPEHRGCLIVNTIAERDTHSETTKAMARGRLQEARDFFIRNLVLAKERGEIWEASEPEKLADGLLGAVVAIMTVARGGADNSTLKNIGSSALAAIPKNR